MFWDNYSKLCNSKGVSPTAAGVAVGVTNAAVSKWKKGTIPNGATLQKIADYFGVSVAYLIDEEESINPTDTSIENIIKITESTEERIVHEVMNKLAEIPAERRPTIDRLFRLSDDEFYRALDMLELLWRK